MEVDHGETCSASLGMIRFVNSTTLHSNCNDALSESFQIETLGVHKTVCVTRGLPQLPANDCEQMVEAS